MLQQPLENVRDPLLRAGIAPRHVRRYVVELREHLADLTERELASGVGDQQAQARARAILGTDAQLVQAMIDRGAPRSLAARAPWAVFGVLPVAAMVVVTLLLLALSMTLFLPYRSLSGTALPDGIRALGAAITILGSYIAAPALAAACIATALRQRLDSRWVWAGLALIAVVSGPLGVHIQFLGPEAGLAGGMRGSVIPTVYDAGHVDVAATFAMMAMRIVGLFALSSVAYSLLRQRIRASLA